MSLNIKNPEAHALAKELSALTGESMTDAIVGLMRERVDQLKKVKQRNKEERLAAIRELLDGLDTTGVEHSSDHADLYGEDGLPR